MKLVSMVVKRTELSIKKAAVVFGGPKDSLYRRVNMSTQENREDAQRPICIGDRHYQGRTGSNVVSVKNGCMKIAVAL